MKLPGEFSGEEMLVGMYGLFKKSQEADWAVKEHDLPKGKWRRVIDPEGEAYCVIITDHYVFGVKTGRVIAIDKKTKEKLPPKMGFHYLLSGDVNPDESEIVVLEQGTHFHVLSIPEFEIKKKVTLPRKYYASDTYPTFSDDGKTLTVYAQTYDYDLGNYIFIRCEYETENYTLVSKTEIPLKEKDRI